MSSAWAHRVRQPTDAGPALLWPRPNWANSPFTLPDVTVQIIEAAGGTATADAVARWRERRRHRPHHHQPGQRLLGRDSSRREHHRRGNWRLRRWPPSPTSGSVTAVNIDVLERRPTDRQRLHRADRVLQRRWRGRDSGAGRQHAAGPNVRHRLRNGTGEPRTRTRDRAGHHAGVRRGQVDSILQPGDGWGSPTPSAGNLFHAYVLQATGIANQYTVLWDSGEQVVPSTADPVGVG